MSDIELAIKSSKSIEDVLQRLHGAQGKGLHEKLDSVENSIPQDLIKQIRYVASVRNSLVHELNSNVIEDRSAFEDTVRQILSRLSPSESTSLQTTSTTPSSESGGSSSMAGCILTIVFGLAIGAAGIFLIGMGMNFIATNIIGVIVFLFIAGALLGKK